MSGPETKASELETSGDADGPVPPSQFKSCQYPRKPLGKLPQAELMAPSGPSFEATVRPGRKPSRKKKPSSSARKRATQPNWRMVDD